MKKLYRSALGCVLVLFFGFLSHSSLNATIYTIDVTLSGVQEVPPNPSTATGIITGTYNDSTRTLTFDLVFNGLSAPTTAAHFHGPAPRGINASVQIGFVGFPVGVTSGAYSNSYVLDSAQNAQILGGLWYVNVHTSLFPGGEIRGQMEEGSLPVELSSFTASILRDKVVLRWSTTQEINNAGFQIERKNVSSNEWNNVGYVTGNGNSVATNNYTFSERLSGGSYSYRLKQIDFNGNFEYFNLSSDINVGIPSAFSISQNYPNPFNPVTRIDYDLPFDSKVNIVLYDITGRVVSSVLNEFVNAGFHSVDIFANNLSSGTYLYRITAVGGGNNFEMLKKMTVLK